MVIIATIFPDLPALLEQLQVQLETETAIARETGDLAQNPRGDEAVRQRQHCAVEAPEGVVGN